MISSITGKVTKVEENIVEIQTQSGIGFELFCTTRSTSQITEGQNISILTYLQVREDAMVLFGFSGKEEKGMFEKLITVSGIGPKMALSILSGIEPSALGIAILSNNVSTLLTVKGIGKKTAERIILELKEKVVASKEENKNEKQSNGKFTIEEEDAIFALKALGFKPFEAEKLVSKISAPNMKAEEIITKSLKGMTK